MNDANFFENKVLTLNTPELNVLDWFIQQKNFPLLLYPTADCESYLRYTVMLDGTIAGSEDPYPTSYERMQNLKDLVIKK